MANGKPRRQTGGWSHKHGVSAVDREEGLTEQRDWWWKQRRSDASFQEAMQRAGVYPQSSIKPGTETPRTTQPPATGSTSSSAGWIT